MHGATEIAPANIGDLLHYGQQASPQALCLPHELGARGLRQIESLPMREHHLARGELLFRQGHGLHALYLVTRGVFKTALVDSMGQSQIMGFHYPRQILGLDAFHSRQHICMASVIIDSAVRVLPLHCLNAVIHEVPALQETLSRLLSQSLAEHEQLLMIVNRRSADQRVAILLFSLACRLGRDGRAARELTLPMSRADFGNYLGLAVETVSRALRELQEAGLITRAGRRTLYILDHERLGQYITEPEEN